MGPIESTILRGSDAFAANRAGMLAVLARVHGYTERSVVTGRNLLRNPAGLSAAGLHVVTVTHGSSTAGGTYQTGLSDCIVMVLGRSRAFLAGPPLRKAAAGEIATEEEPGGIVTNNGPIDPAGA